MTNMTNLEKTALIEAINCMVDCGFSIEHGITSNKANISLSLPTHFGEAISHSFRANYLFEKEKLAQALVDLGDQFGSEPGLSVARDLLIDYSRWQQELPEIAFKFQNFIDVLANLYDEDITPAINTMMFDVAAAAIVDSCQEVMNYRNLSSSYQSVVYSICPPLENTNSQEECPICYDSDKLGKLPKCMHLSLIHI